MPACSKRAAACARDMGLGADHAVRDKAGAVFRSFLEPPAPKLL